MLQASSMDSISQNDQELVQDFAGYINYVKWVSDSTHIEIKELDKYIHEKIKDLIQKFQIIAKNTIAQDHVANSADKGNEQKIEIAGRQFSYSEATGELKRLTDALLADSVLTYERTLIRKKMEEITKALFIHAESSKSYTKNTKESLDNIKKSVLDIIVAFQFQDFVKQRLDHIGFVFESLQHETEKMGKKLSNPELNASRVPDDMVKVLLDKFFLSKVKENYVARLDPEKAKNFAVTIENQTEDDGIELF
jgi:hypothetical protein